jgi:hypothetical protein
LNVTVSSQTAATTPTLTTNQVLCSSTTPTQALTSSTTANGTLICSLDAANAVYWGGNSSISTTTAASLGAAPVPPCQGLDNPSTYQGPVYCLSSPGAASKIFYARETNP